MAKFEGARHSNGSLTTMVWQKYALFPWRTALARTPPALRKNGDVLSTKVGLDATIPLDPPELVASYRRVTAGD